VGRTDASIGMKDRRHGQRVAPATGWFASIEGVDNGLSFVTGTEAAWASATAQVRDDVFLTADEQADVLGSPDMAGDWEQYGSCRLLPGDQQGESLDSERGRGPRPVRLYFASRPVRVATSMVIGATRAPALCPGILAGTKRGQMTGGRRGSLDQ